MKVFVTIALCLSVALAACGDDPSEEPAPGQRGPLAGEWHGTMTTDDDPPIEAEVVMISEQNGELFSGNFTAIRAPCVIDQSLEGTIVGDRFVFNLREPEDPRRELAVSGRVDTATDIWTGAFSFREWEECTGLTGTIEMARVLPD